MVFDVKIFNKEKRIESNKNSWLQNLVIIN